jgi:hypothetical protein
MENSSKLTIYFEKFIPTFWQVIAKILANRPTVKVRELSPLRKTL